MFAIVAIIAIYFIAKYILDKEYQELEALVLKELGLHTWDVETDYDVSVVVRSLPEMEQFDLVRFFEKNRDKLAEADKILKRKTELAQKLNQFLADNTHKSNLLYSRLAKRIHTVLSKDIVYRIHVECISFQGTVLGERTISVNRSSFDGTVYKIEYPKLEAAVLRELGFDHWKIISYYDAHLTVKSRQTLDNYDYIKYFKENRDKLADADRIIKQKNRISVRLNQFLKNNSYKENTQYCHIEKKIQDLLTNAGAYRIHIAYISSAGNQLAEKTINVYQHSINCLYQDPSLIMGKSEYNKLLKEQQKEALNQKHRAYYDRVNAVIDYANEHRASLLLPGSQEQLDKLIAQLFDRTVNSIKKIKTVDSEEWEIIGGFVSHLHSEITGIVQQNQRILAYYESAHFLKVKETCETLMSTQREFNEYITEKVDTVSKLFGVRVIRNETTVADEYNYIRPYKKTISPFTAEVSAAVFASAENNPLDYIVKNFYPNKNLYPEQIQRLYLFVEELETLREAKQIIENYKVEYQQYLGDVPSYVMENDEAGFYSRLGFANIDESVFAVAYQFSYTSGGGMAQRSFTVPMTEETIAELIEVLKSKLTASAFVKEQRTLMTKKLREFIKQRDNYTCCSCGNSVHTEPNLLLEIDHKIPVSKGGRTEESNLQTLCWKCNRSKSNKMIS